MSISAESSLTAESTQHEVDIASVARLIGEPARAAMLEALMSGQALTAGELARAAGIAAATASEHLARLRTGGLVTMVVAGRHRYHRLASAEVASALEALSLIGPEKPARTLRQSQANAAMLVARTCYDHLAGEVGVALHDGLVASASLRVGGAGYELTTDGEALLSSWGLDVAAVRALRRSFARPCLDFTERRPHLAGALGAALLARMVELGWLLPRVKDHRAVRVTPAGWAGLSSVFGVPSDR
ncbi:ArsR/SmtB family transcription factor [Flindersiella endophytica]